MRAFLLGVLVGFVLAAIIAIPVVNKWNREAAALGSQTGAWYTMHNGRMPTSGLRDSVRWDRIRIDEVERLR